MKTICLSMLLNLACVILFAQADRTSELYRIIKTNDSLLFDVGYNTCDIAQFQNLVSENFEFYHDEAGSTLSKPAFIESIKSGLCRLPYKPKRVLIDSTMEVYPLKKDGVIYGAVQNGEHQFYALEKDKAERLASTARFTHLWILENGNWKLSRAISYNHAQ
jgi:hypothetical protein